jgi:hypothetical protein
MLLSRNTSNRSSKKISTILIKILLIVISIFVVFFLLNKIEFPTPNKQIEKIILNENLKIVK